jgi:HNH endonuclease
MDALAEKLEEAVRARGSHAQARAETAAERRHEPAGISVETPSEAPGVDQRAQASPPDPEGEVEVRRKPGERAGPATDVEIVVVATLDQLAAALALDRDDGQGPSRHAPGDRPPPDVRSIVERGGGGPAGFARDRLGTPVHPQTLGLLSCSSRLRRVLVDEDGAVLDLDRARRLATAAQRRALLARDVGCVVPGCDVSGAFCEVHHPTPWRGGGTTDIANLVLVCSRPHTEVHEGGAWDIEMVRGVPWVRPPRWVDPERPLLRNLAHRTAA